MAHFEIKNLNFSYPTMPDKLALEDINLSIEKGEYVTVFGKSGSGKTTLLKHLKSVLTPHGTTSGEVYFDNKLLSSIDLRDQSSKIGYVMQNPDNQIVTDKVWHELAFGLESLGYDQKTIRLRVAEMASYFGIQGWFNKNVSELSGGQKQLLNLASIMAMQPEVLILDEPTSQLDPIAASDFLNTVRKINLELRTTIIITEHRLEDVLYASDKVVVMDKGKIIACDEPRKIGEYLKKENNEMFSAMPTPVQVYYGVEDKFDKNIECPLTVREGGDFLSTIFEGKDIKEKEIDIPEVRLDEGMNPAIMVKEVWYRYDKNSPDILCGTSFMVPHGKLFAIVGGNGTGKSTMLKSICNICKPYRGEILLDGKRLTKYKDSELFKNYLAMMPQDPQSLFVKKTVKEDLLEMLRGSDADKENKISEIADLCEITDLLDSHPFDLSGGEQQRVGLAKVLLTDPKIILLDEPTKGIDSFFKIKFAEILKKLNEKGVTIVMVSHDVEFCARYADICAMFFNGTVITTNTPNKFFSMNSFYTTAANRMSRHIFSNAINCEDVINLCQKNL